MRCVNGHGSRLTERIARCAGIYPFMRRVSIKTYGEKVHTWGAITVVSRCQRLHRLPAVGG